MNKTHKWSNDNSAIVNDHDLSKVKHHIQIPKYKAGSKSTFAISCCICTCMDSEHAGPDDSDLSGSDDDPRAFTRRKTERADTNQECWKNKIVHRKERGRGNRGIKKGKLRIQGKPWRSGTTGTGEGGSISIQGKEATERGERRSENQEIQDRGLQQTVRKNDKESGTKLIKEEKSN